MADHMVEDRLVLEKIKILEGRMKYQIEKLARVATEKQTAQNTLGGEYLSTHPSLCASRPSLVHRSTFIPAEPTKP